MNRWPARSIVRNPDPHVLVSPAMFGLSRRSRRWMRRASAGGGLPVAIGMALLLLRPPAAHAQAQVVATVASGDFSGMSITLGAGPHNLDWVKWGFPILDVNDGPFSADQLSRTTTLRQTRKSAGAAIGALSPVLPAAASASEPYWAYVRTSDDGTRFTWTGGAPTGSPPPGVEVSGGIALVPGAGGHQGWGFAFDVAASADLRLLEIYVDCPPNDSSGAPAYTQAIVKAALGTRASTAAICRDRNQRVQKITVSYSTDPDAAVEALNVAITIDVVAGPMRPIVLLAAELDPYPTTGTGGSDGGAGSPPDGGAGGSGAGSGTGGAGGRVASQLADRPTACAVGDARQGTDAAVSWLVAAALAVSTRRRRRSARGAR
jgi:hypothetical protein